MSEERNYGRPVRVVVSGGFDPVHVGHVRMFREARALGDHLTVVINNDNWIKAKKGVVFMPQDERAELINAFECVDDVVFTEHEPDCEDMSVCGALQAIKPDIFANGGDRFADNIPEVAVCNELGCQMIFNIGHGGKVQSSSWLLKDYMAKAGDGKGERAL